ncbi:MAG TPA: DUF4332 domain-containing protein [Hyphomicrobiaceae bacterium]|nr:DUF4332 domain-containing protein [Hyphomicrobiaceae bacterium]
MRTATDSLHGLSGEGRQHGRSQLVLVAYCGPGPPTWSTELLEASGVDTVPELAQRSPAELARKVAEIGRARHLTRRTPTEAEVTR